MIGFKYTSLSVALVIFITLGVSNVVLQQPTMPQAKRAFFDQSALKDVPYVLFVLGCMLTFLGIYTTFFYLASYAIQEGVTTESTALYFVVSSFWIRFYPCKNKYTPSLVWRTKTLRAIDSETDYSHLMAHCSSHWREATSLVL